MRALVRTMGGNWRNLSRCLNYDPNLWHSTNRADIEQAKSLCGGCPVRQQCLDWALDTKQPDGVWGGLDERERRLGGAPRIARVCGGCGKGLPAGAPKLKQYCNRACSRRKTARKVACARCGGEFVARTSSSRYCSGTCRDIATGRARDPQAPHTLPDLPPRDCDQCGGSFTPRVDFQRFCSSTCGDRNAKARQQSGEHLPERRCDGCGGVFTPCRSFQRFCNRRCAQDHRNANRRVRSLEQAA